MSYGEGAGLGSTRHSRTGLTRQNAVTFMNTPMPEPTLAERRVAWFINRQAMG